MYGRFFNPKTEEKLTRKRKYHISLTKEERDWVQSVLNDSNVNEEATTRAKLILLVDEGEHGPCVLPTEASRLLGLSDSSPSVIMRRVLSEGIEIGVYGKSRGGFRQNAEGRKRILSPEAEQEIRDLYGTVRDDGRLWSQALLASEFEVSRVTIHNTLRRI